LKRVGKLIKYIDVVIKSSAWKTQVIAITEMVEPSDITMTPLDVMGINSTT